jgi:hypothetical protein
MHVCSMCMQHADAGTVAADEPSPPPSSTSADRSEMAHSLVNVVTFAIVSTAAATNMSSSSSLLASLSNAQLNQSNTSFALVSQKALSGVAAGVVWCGVVCTHARSVWEVGQACKMWVSARLHTICASSWCARTHKHAVCGKLAKHCKRWMCVVARDLCQLVVWSSRQPPHACRLRVAWHADCMWHGMQTACGMACRGLEHSFRHAVLPHVCNSSARRREPPTMRVWPTYHR